MSWVTRGEGTARGQQSGAEVCEQRGRRRGRGGTGGSVTPAAGPCRLREPCRDSCTHHCSLLCR